MKFTFISAVVALALALAFCIVSTCYIEHIIDRMEDLCTQAIEAVRSGDDELGKEKIAALAKLWTESAGWLEVMTSHEDLHDVVEHYSEAHMNLEGQLYDEYFRSMSVLEEALKHIRNQEQLSLTNIL